MKKSISRLVLIMVMLAIWLPASAFSQSGYSVNDQIAKIKAELILSKEQSGKVALLLIKMDEKRTADNERLADNPKAMRRAFKKRQETLNKKMKKILSPEQFEKFQKMNFRLPSDRTARQLKELTEKLTLTKEQVEHVQAVYEKYQPELEQTMQSFRGGGENIDRQAIRTKLGEIRSKISEDIQTVLTDEQKEQYKKYLEENRNRGRGHGDHGGGRGNR